MLDDGVPYAQIVRAIGGLSLAAVGRYALSRKSDLAKIAYAEPNITTVVGRLLEAADDARDLRRNARLTAAPVGRARAIKVETDILAKLAVELGVDDTSVSAFVDSVNVLVATLGEFAGTHADAARPLAEALIDNPATADLGAALTTRIEAS